VHDKCTILLPLHDKQPTEIIHLRPHKHTLTSYNIVHCLVRYTCLLDGFLSAEQFRLNAVPNASSGLHTIQVFDVTELGWLGFYSPTHINNV